jgi:hypothetical protein
MPTPLQQIIQRAKELRKQNPKLYGKQVKRGWNQAVSQASKEYRKK